MKAIVTKISTFLIVFSVFCAPHVLLAKQQSITLAYGLETYSFSTILSQFTAETGVKVVIKAFKNNELKSELIQRSNVQQLPDAIIVPSDFLGLKQINVSSIPNEIISPNLYKQALKSAEVNDQLKGIPIVFGNHLVLFYNKSMIEQVPSNWEELLLQRNQFSNPKDFIAWSYYEMYWFIPFLGAFDSVPFSEGKPTLNTPQMAQTLEWYQRFLDQRIIDTNCEYNCVNNRFKAQSLAMAINGVWEYQAYKKALGDNLGVAALPRLGDKKMKSYFSSHTLAFPNQGLQGPKAEPLKKLAEFLQREDIQTLIWSDLNSIPTNNKTLANIEKEGNHDFSIMFAQLQSSNPMPNEHEMAIVWEALLKGLNRYLADVFDAQTAAEYMQVITEKSIENVNGN